MNAEVSCGVIVIYKEKPLKFLLLKQKINWSFPKGQIDQNENPKETALRELKEEAGIGKIKLLDLPMLIERYDVTRNGKKLPKICMYFVGLVDSKNVTIQESEISEYKWVSYEDAIKLFDYESRKKVLREAKEYLENL